MNLGGAYPIWRFGDSFSLPSQSPNLIIQPLKNFQKKYNFAINVALSRPGNTNLWAF